MIVWKLLHPKMTVEHLGLLVGMLSDRNPAPAKTQLNNAYQHGGGWHHFEGFTMGDDNSLSYPGDPSFGPVASTQLRDELILLYPYDWVAIVQPDRTFEICRMD